MMFAVACNSAGLNSFLYYAKNVMNIIMIMAPVLAILSFIFLLTRLSMNPDNQKLIKNLINVIKALVILFFIPVLVNIVMVLVGEKTNISNCYINAKQPDLYAKYIKTTTKKADNILSDPSKYDQSDSYRQLDFSCKSKHIKAQFSCDTIHIVERHMDDLNYYNFDSVISAYGGFDKYMNRLGGFFKKYYGKSPKVRTVYEFQQVSEYVYGMIVMYGFDYYSGNTGKYCKWGANCKSMREIRNNKIPNPASADAFYPGQLIYSNHGLSDKKHFDRIINGKSGMNMTINCNWGVDMVYYKAGIFGTGRTAVNSSASFKKMGLAKSNKIITSWKDAKVGDIVQYFRKDIDPTNPNTWDNWYHVAYVGEVNKSKKTVTLYDGGSYLTGNRNHRNVISMNKKLKNNAIIRVIDLK